MSPVESGELQLFGVDPQFSMGVGCDPISALELLLRSAPTMPARATISIDSNSLFPILRQTESQVLLFSFACRSTLRNHPLAVDDRQCSRDGWVDARILSPVSLYATRVPASPALLRLHCCPDEVEATHAHRLGATCFLA